MRDDSPLYLSDNLFSHWSNGVYFIYEHNRRSLFLCLLLDLSQTCVGFTIKVTHYFMSSNSDQSSMPLISYCLCKQSFTSTRSLTSSSSLWHFNSQFFKTSRVS